MTLVSSPNCGLAENQGKGRGNFLCTLDQTMGFALRISSKS